MAISAAAVTAPAPYNALFDTKIFDITATADADTTIALTHGWNLGASDQEFIQVSFVLLQSFTAATSPNWFVSSLTTSANSITVGKNATTGTGVVGAQVRVIIRKPHSIGL